MNLLMLCLKVLYVKFNIKIYNIKGLAAYLWALPEASLQIFQIICDDYRQCAQALNRWDRSALEKALLLRTILDKKESYINSKAKYFSNQKEITNDPPPV